FRSWAAPRPLMAARVCCRFVALRVAATNVVRQGAGRRQWSLPCQVPQRRMATFAAQPFGPGLFLRDAAFLVAHLECQTSLLAPCFAQKQAPARTRTKREQTLAVVMPQRALRIDAIAHALLQYLGLGKPAVQLALPALHAIAADVEGAAGSRHQRHLAQVLAECGQQLLRQPGRAQQPLALSAIGDDDFRPGCTHLALL